VSFLCPDACPASGAPERTVAIAPAAGSPPRRIESGGGNFHTAEEEGGMSSDKNRWMLFIAFFLITASWFTGCGGVAEKDTAGPLPAPAEETVAQRPVDVIQKMRTEAVSKKVGRWAVVVGISDYRYDTRWNRQKGIPDLKYAHSDARAFADFLLSPEGGAFPADRMRILLNSQATVSEVRVAIGDFLARSLEDDLVILFFAGHGTPDPMNTKNLYLLCHDTQPGKYYGTALPMWEIDVALSRTIKSKKVFVIADACHSAGVGDTRGVSVAGRFNTYLEKLASAKQGVTKITAARSDELSQEREFPEGGFGVFTYYLLKGLKGEADDNRDGFVTMKEGFDYLYDRVRSGTRHSQNPWASAYVSGDIPLGISDFQVLAAVKARMDADRKQSPLPDVKTYQPPTVYVDLPTDSAAAVKLAQAKIAKNEPGAAREIVEGVLARNDSSKPDALCLKISLLLKEGDLKGAEDAEDLLVIPYPDHPAARKGARMVYDYYLTSVKSGQSEEKIDAIQDYLKRHPGGLLEKEARAGLTSIRREIEDRQEKIFNEQLTLAKGFMRQNRFERARRELAAAEGTAKNVRSKYGFVLDTDKLSDLRLSVDRAETEYGHQSSFRKVEREASKKALEERVILYTRFAAENPGNPYAGQALKKADALKKRILPGMQKRYDNLLSSARFHLTSRDFAKSLQNIEEAESLYRQAENTLGIGLQRRDLPKIRQEHGKAAEKHRDYTAWIQADAEAKDIALNDTVDYNRRIAIYADFSGKWPQNPYVENANRAAADLTDRMHRFKERKFQKYFGRAKEHFIAKQYTEAYTALEKAKTYADAGQKQQIRSLAQRYNAPPDVRIVIEKDEVDWETPVRFSFRASDQEGDPVRVIRWTFGDGKGASNSKPTHTYGRWPGSEKAKNFIVVLKATDGHSTVTVKRRILVKKQDRIKTIRVKGTSFRMIRIPAGSFMMGSPTNEPGRYDNEKQHRVTLTQSFWIGETEVTQGLWRAVMGSNPSRFKDCGDDCPVEKVSWRDVQEFITKLNRIEGGNKYRLPTEAEWEHAAKAGSDSAFANGGISELKCGQDPNLDTMGWYCGNSGVSYSGCYDASGWGGPKCAGTHPVARKQPNAWGLYDMHGNVWEWCNDWFGDYPSGSVTDPAGPSKGAYRVDRGGSWLNNARYCRAAYRNGYTPGYGSDGLGCRLVRIP